MAAPRAATLPKSFTLAAFFFIGIAAVAVQSTEWMGLLNGKLLDTSFTLWRKLASAPVARDVAVIGIDVDDLREFSDRWWASTWCFRNARISTSFRAWTSP